MFSSGSEIIIRSGAPKKQLSNFIPTKDNIIGETHNEWTVMLFPQDVGVHSSTIFLLIKPDVSAEYDFDWSV